VLTLGSGLKRRGHNVYIASGGGQLLKDFLAEKVIYIPIPIKTKKEINPKILLSMWKLSGLIKEYRIDIVHSNSRTTQVLGSLLNNAIGITHISTCHGFFKKRFLRKIFPCWGKKTIAISQQVKDHLIIDFKLQENNIRVIHNGIDIERFNNQNPYLSLPDRQAGGSRVKSQIDIRREFGLNDGPVVGIVARLSDVKGHVYLIEAMPGVLEKLPNVQLMIVGEGKTKEGLVRLTKKLGIEKNVFFIPEVNDTRSVLSIMDLFVMPSLKEGLGIALMEAMASGVAVIGSDVGGIKTLIQDGYSGLLVKPADTVALTGAILDLLFDSSKRQSLRINARAFISQNFSQETMVEDTQKLYTECLNKKD
jgi:glycosyltransferase involved in cell wall biosynthesis